MGSKQDNTAKNPFVAENGENEKVVLNKLELLLGPRVPAPLQACQPTQKRNPINWKRTNFFVVAFDGVVVWKTLHERIVDDGEEESIIEFPSRNLFDTE